jgi:hypothetical protein
MLAMEKDFDSKLKIQGSSSNGRSVQRSKSFAFRAPQENFSVQDFELGKIYGVGSYSKVHIYIIFSPFSFCKLWWFLWFRFCSFVFFAIWVVSVCYVFFFVDCWVLTVWWYGVSDGV